MTWIWEPPVTDTRRLEVVVDGLPLFGGVQLAVDTTLVSTLNAHRGTADRDGAVLETARRRKQRRYPELVGPRSRARLVVLAGEVAVRWSEETKSFIRHLAKAKARGEPPLMRRRIEQAMTYLGQSYLGPVLLRPVLLRPGQRRPGLVLCCVCLCVSVCVCVCCGVLCCVVCLCVLCVLCGVCVCCVCVWGVWAVCV